MSDSHNQAVPVIPVSEDDPAPYYIDLSDEDHEEDDVKLIEIRNDTNDLINQDSNHKVTKQLSDVECPICFDEVTRATVTTCGHIFCLECIQKSIASSNARGQIRGKRGVGLCPLCRKRVVFKDTVVMRLRVSDKKVEPPALE